jgi:hypothetical protein
MMRGGWPFFSVTQRGLVSSHSGGGASTDFFSGLFWIQTGAISPFCLNLDPPLCII